MIDSWVEENSSEDTTHLIEVLVNHHDDALPVQQILSVAYVVVYVKDAS